MEIYNLKKVEPTFESLVDEFFGRNNIVQNYLFGDNKVNIQEFDDKYALEMILAGYKKEDIKIGIEENILTIESEVNEDKTETNQNFSRYEFRKKSFKRGFRIPDDADVNGISASHEDGILNVNIPKMAKSATTKKTVDIK